MQQSRLALVMSTAPVAVSWVKYTDPVAMSCRLDRRRTMTWVAWAAWVSTARTAARRPAFFWRVEVSGVAAVSTGLSMTDLGSVSFQLAAVHRW